MKKLLLLLFISLLGFGCASERMAELKFGSTEVYTHANRFFVLDLRMKNMQTGHAVQWHSSNPHSVTVSANGIIQTHYVGTSKITATARELTASCRVIVEPKYVWYDETLPRFGVSKTTIRNWETRYLWEEYSDALFYAPYTWEEEIVREVGYYFGWGGLEEIIYFLYPAYSSRISSFLSERYPFLGKDGYWQVWGNDKVWAGYTIWDGIPVISYTPPLDLKSDGSLRGASDRLSAGLPEAVKNFLENHPDE